MSDNNKFEQLIELFIAEDEQGAKDLFHEIVVEKSRDIYESLVDEEQVEETAEVEEDAEDETVEESGFDEAEIGGDQADDMIDDIEADEQGLSMEADADDEEIEDRVVDIEWAEMMQKAAMKKWTWIWTWTQATKKVTKKKVTKKKWNQ
jgi:hypothetical protein